MSNLDNLIQKIIDDAKAEADSIGKEADKKRNEIIHEQEVKGQKERSIVLEKTRKEAELQENRILSNAELTVRDNILRARQDILDKVFNLAKDKLINLSNEEYGEFIKTKLQTFKLKGSEVLVVPKSRIDYVKSLGLKTKVSDEETVDSGFVLLDDNVNMNFSFNTLIDFLRDDLEADIAKMLFKAND